MSLVFVFFFTGYAVAALPENPMKNAKVGDWIEMKLITDQDGRLTEQTLRQKIVKKDDKTVTLKSECTFQGKKMVASEAPISLNKPYYSLPTNSVGTLNEGDETITSVGKSFQCHWIKRQISFDIKGQKITQVTTVWSSPDVPIAQVVKMVCERNEGGKKTITTQELIGFGNEK